MTRRKKKSRIAKSLSRVGKEATGTVISALSLIPGIGTAIGVADTGRKALRTARATGEAGKALKSRVRGRKKRKRR